MAAATRRPGRPKGSTQAPEARREALLTAAEDAIRRHGPNVSMEQIAAQGAVAKATLYDNFRGKDGLTEALLDRYGRRLLEAFAEALGRPVTAEQLVRGGIAIFVRHIEADPEIYRFIVRYTDDDALADEIAAPIAALVGSVLAAQGDDPTAADLVAHATLGAVVGATGRWSSHRSLDRAEFEALLGRYAWAGLQAAGVRPGPDPVDLGALVAAIERELATTSPA